MDNANQVWEKNDFYRAAFRNLVRIANIQAVVIVVLSFGFLFYVKTATDHSRYFVQTPGGQQMQLISLNRPNMGINALSSWVEQAITQIMTFGFNDIDQRFTISRRNFTPKGWDSFFKAMVSSKIVDSIVSSQQLITVVPLSTASLTQEGLINGVYSWQFEMPILITFRSGSAQRVVYKKVRVMVEPVPTSDNPSGVGISEWYLY